MADTAGPSGKGRPTSFVPVRLDSISADVDGDGRCGGGGRSRWCDLEIPSQKMNIMPNMMVMSIHCVPDVIVTCVLHKGG